MKGSSRVSSRLRVRLANMHLSSELGPEINNKASVLFPNFLERPTPHALITKKAQPSSHSIPGKRTGSDLFIAILPSLNRNLCLGAMPNEDHVAFLMSRNKP
jgi:hypothetical protein